MKFAIGIPNCREGMFYRPQIAGPEQIEELTRLAERLGYDAIWAADFMTPVAEMGFPESAKPHWYELMVSLSYLAAVTERIKLGAGGRGCCPIETRWYWRNRPRPSITSVAAASFWGWGLAPFAPRWRPSARVVSVIAAR